MNLKPNSLDAGQPWKLRHPTKQLSKGRLLAKFNYLRNVRAQVEAAGGSTEALDAEIEQVRKQLYAR